MYDIVDGAYASACVGATVNFSAGAGPLLMLVLVLSGAYVGAPQRALNSIIPSSLSLVFNTYHSLSSKVPVKKNDPKR